MSDFMLVEVHEDGSTTGFVGTSSKTFAKGNRKENTQAAVNWATAILYDLEGVEFG